MAYLPIKSTRDLQNVCKQGSCRWRGRKANLPALNNSQSGFSYHSNVFFRGSRWPCQSRQVAQCEVQLAPFALAKSLSRLGDIAPARTQHEVPRVAECLLRKVESISISLFLMDFNVKTQELTAKASPDTKLVTIRSLVSIMGLLQSPAFLNLCLEDLTTEIKDTIL